MIGDNLTSIRKDFIVLMLLVLSGFCIRLYFLQFYTVISADGISYISIAKDFISGQGLSAAMHYPPFFPILLGLASTLFHDFEAAGLAVSIVMGSIIVVPVYLLGIEFFDRNVGIVAAVLAITWPTLRYWSTNVMSQATYITLLLFGVYFLWQAYKTCRSLPAILAGVFFGCAHLTRSEGILVLFAQVTVLVMFTFINRLPVKKLLYVLLSVCVFCIVFSP
jgi:4-amino-4-deoxy-L-arabinose transferase-like glycosyltransferase